MVQIVVFLLRSNFGTLVWLLALAMVNVKFIILVPNKLN